MPDNEESFPRMLGGRYRLDAKLGHGGMGVVYRATDLVIQRPVAVKLIRGGDGVEIDEEVAGRFLREAKNTARVQHEHIIEVYDLGRSEAGDLFFVMELLEGESLSARMRRLGRLSVDATVHIATQMCSALEVAHQAGVIHRDLKPANVMLLERAGDDAFVKVLDFGVAKSYSQDQQTDLTHTGMLVGTVEYMAPEQIMGRKVDGRTDVYALGVVLYRMLVGKAPFRDGTVPAMIHWHLNVMPKSLRDGVKDLPAAIDHVVLRCLSKRPEDRFASMAALAEALERAASPDELGLPNLGYDGADVYTAADETRVASPKAKSEVPPPPAPPAPPPAALAPEEADLYDDKTIKMERGPMLSAASGPAPIPAAVPRVELDVSDRTAVMVREEPTAARGPVPDELRRAEPKACAMCHTLNPPHARACTACGVSLAADEQAAVRARVAAPRTAHAPAPHLPPPTSGAYPAGQGVPGSGPHPYMPAHPAGGAPAGWPAGPPHGSGTHPQAQPSMWRRFLSWAGIRR